MLRAAPRIFVSLLVLVACDTGESVRPEASDRTPAAPAVTEAAADAGEPSHAALVAALREPDAFARYAALSRALASAGPDAAGRVPDLLRDVSFDLGTIESALLVRFWAAHAPEEAARWALFASPHARRGAFVEYAVAAWAREDPAGAADAVRAFVARPGPFVEVAELALVDGWLHGGAPGLVDYIRSLGISVSRQRALAAYLRSRIRSEGPEVAIDFAESVPDDDPKYRLDVLRQAGSELAIQHPEVAAAWCERVCSEGDGVRTLIAQRWAAQAGVPAMEWASRAEHERDRLWAVKGAFRGWYRNDAAGFSAWLEGVARGGGIPTWLQPVLELYAGALAPIDPEAGLAWAARIDDPETRERSQVNVARQWRRRDREAAESWLGQSGLSEDALDRVRDPQPTRMGAMPAATPGGG